MKKRFLIIASAIFLIILTSIFIYWKTQDNEETPNDNNVTITANTYYVSVNNGSDSSDGSLDSPWKTIGKAAETVGPGDIVYVRNGVYNEKLTMKTSGVSKAYVTFKNYDGETPTVNGNNLEVSDDDSENALVNINDISYVKVIGFNITNYVSNSSNLISGIKITGSSKNVEIRNCKVSEIKTTYSGDEKSRDAHGIAAYGTNGDHPLDGLIIDNCEVSNCILGQSESLVLNGNVTNFKVTNNKVHDNDNIGIDFIGYEKVASKNDYARNGICSGNLVWNVSSANNKTYNEKCADGIYVDGGASIIIEKNKVWSSDIGIETASEHRDKVTDKVTVRNNLIYNNSLYGISMGGAGRSNGKATNIKIYNNTVYNNNTNMNIQKNCQFDSNVIKNNIFYEGQTFAGDNSNIVISNNIDSDPKFVQEGSDFHLDKDSPAINAGVNDSYIGKQDLVGKNRIVNEKVDCGSYEVQ